MLFSNKTIRNIFSHILNDIIISANMKRILGVIIAIALVASFCYGLSVGTYKIFPYEYLNEFKDEIESNERIIQNSDISSFELSDINIKNDARNKKY